MNNQDNLPKNRNHLIDLPMVKLALAAMDKPENIGPCLSDMDLTNLVEDRLNESEEEKLFRHINHCADCRQDWYDAVAAKESERTFDPMHDGIPLTSSQKAKLQGIPDLVTKSDSLFKVIADHITRFFGNLKITFAVSMAAAACVLIYINFIKPPSDTTVLIAAIEKYLELYPPVPQKIFDQKLVLPWEGGEENYQGFEPAEADAPQKLSFGAGLWEGRYQLTDSTGSETLPRFLASEPYAGGKKSAWMETPYKKYHELGQWCAVMTVVCAMDASKVSTALWDDMGRTIVQLLPKFEAEHSADEYNEIATKKIKVVIDLIESGKGNQPSNRILENINNEINVIVKALGPATPPQ